MASTERKYSYTPITGSNSYTDDSSIDEVHHDIELPSRPRRNRSWVFWLNVTSHVLAWTLVASLLYGNIVPRTWGWDRFNQHRLFPAQLTYSPAQTAIEYEVRVFRQGIEGEVDGVDPAFTGPPSDRLDDSWSNLYNYGMSTISRDEASHLTNKTSIIPNQPDNYIIQLDVFHHLHCLNRIRKALNPHYFCPHDNPHCDDHRAMAVNYEPTDTVGEHLMHCLHSLRQSLMCHADITPMVWHKSAAPKETTGEFFNQGFLSVAHTCRSFDKVKEWALGRQMHGPFDYTIVPEDDGIVIPEFHGVES